jgi:hypothetical protein
MLPCQHICEFLKSELINKLSTLRGHVYAVELTDDELTTIEEQARSKKTFGVVEGTIY